MLRSTTNTKLVQRHVRQKALQDAKSSSKRFGAKQSRFQLRQEELHVAQSLQREGPLPSSHESAADANLAVSSPAVENFSRFDRRSTRGAPSDVLVTTTTTATFGLPLQRKNQKVASGGTRSARRVAKFRLADDNSDDIVGNQDASLVGGLLGTVGRRRVEDEDGDAQLNEMHQRKKSRAERFQEVMANSKEHRSHMQREREERSAQTTAIDAEFKNVIHLLERRDRVREEREEFERSGRPEVRALLQQNRANRAGKMLKLHSDGSFTVTPLASAESGNMLCLNEACMKLLDKVRADVSEHGDSTRTINREQRDIRQAAGAGIHLTSSTYAAQETGKVAEVDEFDLLMQSMRLDTRKAIASERTLTEEEQRQRQLEQQMLEMDRGAIPSFTGDTEQPTHAEWLSRGGDFAYRMDDGAEDNLDISSAYDSVVSGEDHLSDEEEAEDDADALSLVATTGGTGALEKLLSSMEALARDANPARAARVERNQAYHQLLLSLYRYSQSHVLHAAQTFRALLVEAQRSLVRHGGIDKVTLLLLHATSRIFPMTDYRHAVTTPFFVLLCSLLLQMRLKTVDHVRDYAVVAGLLCDCMLAGGKFCAEAIVAPLNIIALQVPHVLWEPVRLQGLKVPIPLVGRGDVDVALLQTGSCCSSDAGGQPARGQEAEAVDDEEAPLCGTLAILETGVSPVGIVRYAYRLLSEQADAFRNSPAFEYCLFDPFMALHRNLSSARASGGEAAVSWQPCAAVLRDHDALLAKVSQYVAEARANRTPLAMRSFRPRPIRQFDPLLQYRSEDGEGISASNAALKNEVRIMKRELREDRKRVVRHLQAEANVERRVRERATAEVEAQRDQKYRELMGSLQAQQHVMNTVDGLLAKARSKKSRPISGAAGSKDTSGGDS
ncbi:putative Nop14 like family [Trypanosoma vivax]|nr:hypothetical protein TRVL_04534 [Trypanosoma vivax]KAH8607497.1 putative Nop14 like family [Trypanosoma vivax]